MAEINDINIESADDVKIEMIVSTFSKTLQRMSELDFTPSLGDWGPDTKSLLANCGLIKLDKTGKMIPFPQTGLDKDVKNKIYGIVKILKFCAENNIDIKQCDTAALVKQMNAQKVKVATNKNVQLELITFLRNNTKFSILSPESMKRHCDVIDMVSGKMDIEPGRKMSEFESIALFDYATPIIRDRIILPINKIVRENEKRRAEARKRGYSEKSIRELYPLESSFPELEKVNGYYDFLGTVTMLITKATNAKNAAKTEAEKERSSVDLKKLKEIKEKFILEIGKEIAATVKTFATTKKNMSMETRRSKIEHDRLGVPEGLIPFLYENHIPAENFDELLATVGYLGAAKKYNEEVNGVHEVAKPRKKKASVTAEIDKKPTFNAYEEIRIKFGLDSADLISEFLLQGRNVFVFEKFMGSRLEYEYEKANIARQLRDMADAYPELLEKNGKPVEVFRAGVLDDTGSMSAKRREHPYSADKHVESGSKIKTSYISLTESPLIMGQFLYPFNSTNERTVPTVVDMRVIYQQLMERYQELESKTFKFTEQDEFLECLSKYAETKPEKREEILRKIEKFKEQNRDAIQYERNMEHPEGFVSRASVEMLPNTYSRTSAELLLKGIIPAASITEMDYLTADILQRVCNTTAFDSVINESRNRKHNIIGGLTTFIDNKENLKELGLEDYELDFIKQYYIKGIPIDKIISIGVKETDSDNTQEKPDLQAIGTAIRNSVTGKLLKSDKFLQECLGLSKEDAQIVKGKMQELYTAKMGKTSDTFTDKHKIARDIKTNSGLYIPYESDIKRKYIVADIDVVPKDKTRILTIKTFRKVVRKVTEITNIRGGKGSREVNRYDTAENKTEIPFEVRYQAQNAAKELEQTTVYYNMEPKQQETDDRDDIR